MTAQWQEGLTVLGALVMGTLTGARLAWGFALAKGWRAGFNDHRDIVTRVWGADPVGWVDYAKRAEAARIAYKAATAPSPVWPHCETCKQPQYNGECACATPAPRKDSEGT